MGDIAVIGVGNSAMDCARTAIRNGGVVAGPAEATALGNIMVQARAAGVVSSLAEMRRYHAMNRHLMLLIKIS